MGALKRIDNNVFGLTRKDIRSVMMARLMATSAAHICQRLQEMYPHKLQQLTHHEQVCFFFNCLPLSIDVTNHRRHKLFCEFIARSFSDFGDCDWIKYLLHHIIIA